MVSPDTVVNDASRIRRAYDEHGIRMAKYLTGSVIAMVVSTVTFAATFGPGVLGSKGASLAASTTGAVANYFLNRRWAWGLRGRANVRRELLPYWTTVIVIAVVAAIVTGSVNAIVREYTDHRGVRTMVNTAAFLGTYGVSFTVKYGIFNRLFRRHLNPLALKHDDERGRSTTNAA